MDPLELLAVNIAKAIQVIRYGREYLVADATLIVPGVLNGSDGPLLYTPEDTGANVDAWNGIPLVIYHPTKGGRNVSARRPDVINVGTVYGATFKDKLTAKAWFDVEMLKKAGAEGVEVLNSLREGRAIELSTGLFTHQEKAQAGAIWQPSGKPYKFIARNHRPDHLAVLPGQVGACSLYDGCGILVNSETPKETGPMKDKLIAWLTTNCECWKDKDDKETLNAMSEAKLLTLKKAAVKAKKAKEDGVVANAARKALGKDAETLTPEEVAEKLGTATFNVEEEEEEEEETPTPAPVKKGKSKTVVVTGNAVGGKKITLKDIQESGDPALVAIFNSAANVEKKERVRLANLLVANAANDGAKKAAYAVYVKMPIPQLEQLVEAMPVVANTRKGAANDDLDDDDDLDGLDGLMLGAGGGKAGLRGGAATFNRDDTIPDPEMDYESFAVLPKSMRKESALA